MKQLITILLLILSLSVYTQTDNDKRFINEINKVRTDPKSLIPYVETYKKNVSKLIYLFNKGNNKKGVSKLQHVLSECDKTITFLNQQNPLDSLTFEGGYIYFMTKLHCLEMVDSNKTFHKNLNSIPNLVSQNCAMAPIGTGIEDPIMNILTMYIIDQEYYNHDHPHRMNKFNENIKSVSVFFFEVNKKEYYNVINFLD